MSKSAIQYFRLRAESPERRARLCREFYLQVYRDAFPRLDEAETPDTWLPLMGQTVPEGQPLVHIVLAANPENAILGGIVFERYRRTGCWLLTYIAVRPDARHRHIATGLLAEAVQDINTCGDADWVLFAEAEDPERISDADEHARAKARLPVLGGLGMKRLPVAYVQPALAPGKRALDDLMLLCYAPDSEPFRAEVPARRIINFLAEFYAALGQAASLYLLRMSAALAAQGVLKPERLTPLACDDAILGTADAISLRMTFFHAHTVPRKSFPWMKRVAPEPREIPLKPLREALERNPQLKERLAASVQSFHQDIVTPYAAESALPLVVQCERFDADLDRNHLGGREVEIVIPPVLMMQWEDRTIPVRFTAGKQPYRVPARLVDSVTFFQSGYLAYSVSFIFQAARRAGRVTVNAPMLLVLEAVANPAGAIQRDW